VHKKEASGQGLGACRHVCCLDLFMKISVGIVRCFKYSLYIYAVIGHIDKIMQDIIQISSKEFKEKQKTYFELADKGAQIILRRGRKQAYILMPVDDSDLVLSPELQAKIDQGLQDIVDGKGKEYTLEELREKMGI
jgi:hypothetical protein